MTRFRSMQRRETARQAAWLGNRLVVVLLCAVIVPRLHAQTPAGLPPRTTEARSAGEAADSTARSVIEQQPPLLYARDADGRPFPLINVPLSTIERLLNQQDGLLINQQPPAFQIQTLSIIGNVRDQICELDVTLDVSLLTPVEEERARWTAVPLRFHDASMLATPVHEGDGRLHVGFSAEEGHQGWLLHQSSGEHRIKLKFAVPLNRSGGSTQFRFFPPLANQSKLQLTVPGQNISASLENARNVDITQVGDEQTLVTATDLRDQVVVSWREGVPSDQEPPTYLDVRGDIRVTIDGPGAIRSNLTLDLQSYGRPIEEFSLRLPPNTRIVSGNQLGYTITELAGSATNDADRATAQIKLEKPATQARVQLVTQTTEPEQAASSVNVASFEVIGAIRQSGRVALLTSEEWLVYWTLGPSVRRVQNVDAYDTSQERKQLASFQYFRQPCRLDVQIRPQGRRVGVEPNYRMTVLEDRIDLEAELNYQVRGARISFLDFSLNGWELDDIGPNGAVENDDFGSRGSDPIKLRLTQATSGDLPLTLKLHRPLQGTRGTLRVPLPWPAADSIKPGSLVISSADAVVLTFRSQETDGLVQDPSLASAFAELEGAKTNKTLPTAFRMTSDRPITELVVEYEIRAQETVIRMDTSMELSTETAQVAQRMAYRILYQPAARLQLDVPRPLLELMTNPRYRNQVELRVDGRVMPADAFQNLLENADDTRDRSLIPLTLALERPRLGNVNLELRFVWPMRPIATAEYTPVPLVTPRTGELVSNVATLTPVGPLRVEPSDDGTWLRDADLVTSDSLQTIGMTNRSSANLLRVRVAQRQEDMGDKAPASATVVDRAWLQTWLAEGQRIDRAVFRFVTGSDVVRIDLPVGFQQVVTLVDGREVPAVPSGRELVVPLSGDDEATHTLELSLTFAERPNLGEMQFQAPEIRAAIGPRRWFWQLLVPANEHLVSADPRLTSANRWMRLGWFWRRIAGQSQTRLEYWTDATQQPTLPTGLNEYLFSSFNRMENLTVRTCTRRTLVYAASSFALGLGLALLYWPRCRHPGVVLGIAVLLLTAVLLFSDVALLFAQASLLGVLLALMAAFLSLVLRQLGGRGTDTHWVGQRSSEPRSGSALPWNDGSAPHSTITSPGASVPAIGPDSKA